MFIALEIIIEGPTIRKIKYFQTNTLANSNGIINFNNT